MEQALPIGQSFFTPVPASKVGQQVEKAGEKIRDVAEDAKR